MKNEKKLNAVMKDLLKFLCRLKGKMEGDEFCCNNFQFI